jgi:hypothetical protein
MRYLWLSLLVLLVLLAGCAPQPFVVVKPNYERVYEGEIVWETKRSKEEIGALLDQAQIRLAWTLDGKRQEKLFPLSTEKGPDWGTSVP